MTQTLTPPTGATPPADKPPRTWVRWVILVACLPVVAMWVYAYGFASKEAAVHLDDTAWTQRAESICEAANLQRDQLFDPRKIDDAGPDALIQRATIVDEATDIIERMLNEIVVVQPVNSADRSLVAQWEGYYRTLIQDRRAYTQGLREGNPNQFNETVVEGQPLSSYLDDFAKPNFMPECVSPNDLS